MADEGKTKLPRSRGRPRKSRPEANRPADQVENPDEAALAAVATVGRRFPSGAPALSGKGDDDETELINVSLQRVTFPIRDTGRYTDVNGKRLYHDTSVTMLPTARTKVRVEDARRTLLAQTRPGHAPKTLVAPPEGNCDGRMTFEDGGRRFDTCPYGGCKHHPWPTNREYNGQTIEVRWSIWQSQHRVALLGTEPAIKTWIEIDGRREVYAYGLFIIQRREDARRERMGFGGRSRSTRAVY